MIEPNIAYKTIDFTLLFDSNDKSFWDDFGHAFTSAGETIAHGAIHAASEIGNAGSDVLAPALEDATAGSLVEMAEFAPLVLLRTDFVDSSDIVVDKLEALGEDLESGFRAVVHVGRS